MKEGGQTNKAREKNLQGDTTKKLQAEGGVDGGNVPTGTQSSGMCGTKGLDSGTFCQVLKPGLPSICVRHIPL